MKALCIEVMVNGAHFRFEVPRDALDVDVSADTYNGDGGYFKDTYSVTYHQPGKEGCITCTVELL